MSVFIDGSTMSALLFSHLNSKGSQYGFLFGEKVEQVEEKISDSQIHICDVTSYIYVSSFVTWPSQDCLHNRSGHINNEWIQHNFPNTEQKLVGWYSFRHKTTLRPSLREKTLHKNLATLERFTGQPQEFLFFLCTSSSSTDMSTHTCSYGFMQANNGLFLNLPVSVINLGDTTRQEYKKSSATLPHSKTVQGLLQSFEKNFLKPSGEIEHTIKVNHLASSINKSLMSVHSNIADSETTLGLLEAEVADLKQQLDQLEQEEAEEMFQIQAENRRKQVEEEIRKQNAEEEAEDQKQLDKLLIDLRMTSNDIHSDASMTDNDQLESFTLENSSEDQNIRHSQVFNLSSSLFRESALVNSSDRNTNFVGESSSTTQLASDNHMAFIQRDFVNGTSDSALESVHRKPIDNISDSFPFVNKEFKFKQNAIDAKRHQRRQTSKTTSIDVMQNQVGNKKLTLNVHEFSQFSEGSGVQDLQNTIIQHKDDNAPMVNSSDNANSDIIDVDSDETSQLSHDESKNKYNVSSSPIF